MTKLLVSIVVDNSSSMKGEKLNRLKTAIHNFHHQVNSLSMEPYFEYLIVTYHGLDASVLKGFKDNELTIDDMIDGGLALLDKAITLSLNQLVKRVSDLTDEGVELYKPWLILLSDGQSYETLEQSVNKLINIYKTGKLSYFPFALSNYPMDERLEELKKVKRPIIVDNNQYELLFHWLFDTIKQRISAPINESMRLASNCFDGWTIK